MRFSVFTRRWRYPKAMIGLILFEFPLTVATLALFGIAAPNLYRTKLWMDGGENGFNSHPKTILYSYANHRPLKIPLVWSQFITNFNVIISVLSMFILLVKSVMYVMHTFIPFLSIVVHGTLLALYSYSVHAQTSPDTIDPLHKATGPPWYITKPCSVTRNKSLEGYCKQAKSSFIVTAIMLGLFTFHVMLAVWSLFPRQEQEEEDKIARMDHEAKGSPDSDVTTEDSWRVHHQPKTPGSATAMKSPLRSPMTPRTTAFHQLESSSRSGLPLRDRYGE